MSNYLPGPKRQGVAVWAKEHGYDFEQIRIQQGIVSELGLVGRFNDSELGTVYVDLWWTDRTKTGAECELSYFGNGPDSVRANMPGARAVFNTGEG